MIMKKTTEEEEEDRLFEEEVNRLSELDDPLNVFDRYYQHLARRQADLVTQTHVLERATQTFVDDRRYRNDPRYLRLWLSYALRCREPEDVFAFLAMHSIAADLAAYYEEYAMHLERKGDIGKAGLVLKAGVERGAQPIERLSKKWLEFGHRHPEWDQSKDKEKDRDREKKAVERAVYMLADDRLSFEEARARSWRKAGGILKSSYKPPAAFANVDPFEGFDDEAVAPADPDELTHISIYRDNTADLRELAKSLKENNNRMTNDGGGKRLLDFDQFILDKQKTLRTEAPLPLTTDVHRSDSPDDNLTHGDNDGNHHPGTIQQQQQGEYGDSLVHQGLRNGRLSLIPEESELTSTTINVTRKQRVFGLRDLEQMRRDAGSGVFVQGAEPLHQRLAMLEKSIGRDGVGNNQTVASLRVAIGHYFIERRLSATVLLGIDLEADIGSGSDLHQVAIKLASHGPWEAVVLKRLEGIIGVPVLGKVCQHPDMTVITFSYFAHGSLASLLKETLPLQDEKLLLFWTRELLLTVHQINERGCIHGRISADHVLVRLGPVPLVATFQPDGSGGWRERGVALVSFSHALLIAQDEEEEGDIYLDDEAAAVYGTNRLRHVDVVACSNLISRLLAGRPQLVYAAAWRDVTSILQQTFSPLRAVQRLDIELATISLTLPTLKSLLTRLEISLLERQ